MSEKSALIVDDSRTAQKILQKMLEKQQLRVDTADTAETAIEYLSRHAPDIIFMDHMMPGMDGFQAVEAIKENPKTATIPIVMYTSKGGEVYVGQARALGAVGVLSKDVRPAELNQVLERLKLVGGTDVAEPEEVPAASGKAPAQTPPNAGVALTDLTVRKLARATADAIRLPDTSASLHDEIRSLRAELRQAMDASNKQLHKDLAAEIQLAADRQQAHAHNAIHSAHRPWKWAVLAGIVGIAFGAVLASALNGSSAPPAGNDTASIATSDAIVSLRAENIQLRDQLAEVGSGGSAQAWLDAVTWAFNSHPGSEFSLMPLADSQLQRLTGLVEQLGAANFKGTVALDVHIGDFCLARGDNDALALPPVGAAISDCTQLGFGAEEAESIAGRQSISFANFVASSPLLGPAGIEVQLNPIGNREPRIAYPDPASVGSAEDWNAIAQRNQRVEIRLIPEAGSL